MDFFLCGLLLIWGCDKQHCYRHVHKYASSFAGQILRNKNAESKKCVFHILIENCQFAFQQDIPNLNTRFTLYSRNEHYIVKQLYSSKSQSVMSDSF